MTDEEETQAQQQHQQQSAVERDRVLYLRPVLFDLFADHTVDPPMLNYVDMVMCHCLRSFLVITSAFSLYFAVKLGFHYPS